MHNHTSRHEDVWESGGVAPPFLTSSLDGGEWSIRPCRSTPEERASGTHWIGGLVGLTACLDALEWRKISSPSRESNPTVQSVSHCYINSAVPASVAIIQPGNVCN
jgi:hypothetical protein